MTEQEYRQLRALSYSGIKDLCVSPLRFWHNHLNPERIDEPTDAMRLGTALHCAVLQPDRFAAEFAEPFDAESLGADALDTVDDLRSFLAAYDHKATAKRKEELTQLAESCMELTGDFRPIVQREVEKHARETAGKTILGREQWRRVMGMAKALRNQPRLMELLADGEAEKVYVAEDPETGVLLKGRLDWVTKDFTVDLKSFSQRPGFSISRSINDAIYYQRYWVQAFFYAKLRELNGEGMKPVVIPFVQSEEPYDVQLRVLKPAQSGETHIYWEQALVLVRQMTRMYAHCLKEFGDRPWREVCELDAVTNDDIKQFSFGGVYAD